MMEKNDKVVHKFVMKTSECPITKVTVYKNQARVSRKIKMTVKAGISEICIKKFVDILEDSITVEGKGNAIIAEVIYQRQFVTKDEATTTEKMKQLEEELNKLQEEKLAVDYESQKVLLAKQWDFLDNFAETASKNSQRDSNIQLDSAYFSSMIARMQQCKDIGEKLEADRMDLDKKNKELNDKIDVIQCNLYAINDSTTGKYENRECLIILEAEEEAEVELSVSYVVLGASWTPFYSIQMSADQGILKIFYYGLICQKSGEDWKNVKLYLSTAHSPISGIIPSLPTVQLSQAKLKEKMTSPTSYLTAMEAEESLKSRLYLLCPELDKRPKYKRVLGIPEEEHCTGDVFEIAHFSTVPSDFTEHRVSVAVIDLKPTLSYLTVPQVSPLAYLQAKVTNTSHYSLLAGKANIFLDGSFVAKTDIKTVAPQEEFVCSLGVDPAVRVDYKPFVRFNSTSGVVTKTRHVTTEQTIEIRNMHDYSIKITVRDNLPHSTEKKIKVNLISPKIDTKHPEMTTGGVRLTKGNHVEWDLDIKGLDKAEVVLVYNVEYSAKDIIRFMSHCAE